MKKRDRTLRRVGQQRRYHKKNGIAEPAYDAARALAPVIDGLGDIKEQIDRLASAAPAHDSTTSARLADEVREMKSMLSYLLDSSQIEKEKGMPRTLLALRRILSERNIAPEYIDTLIDELRQENGGQEPDLKTL